MVSKWLTEYGVPLSLGVVALSVLHVWAFTGYNTPTTLAILPIVDRTALILATAVVFVPLALVSILGNQGLLFPLRLWRSSSRSPLATSVAILSLGAVLLVLIINTAAIVVVMLVVVTVVIACSQWRQRKAGTAPVVRTPTEQTHRRVNILLPVVLPMAFIVLSTPWSPREELTTDDTIYTGYVIGADEGRYLTVIEDPKSAVWVAVEEVTTRRLCAYDSWWGFEPLPSLFLDNVYDDCLDDSLREIVPTP